MLKKLFITMLVGMMTLGAMAQGGKFTVKGTFEGRKDSVTIAINDVTNWKTIAEETRAITGEMHELTFDLNDAALLSVTDAKGLTTVLPAIPGETLLFYQNDHKVTHLGGSQFYVDYDEAQQTIEPILVGINECNKHLSGEFGSLTWDEYNLYTMLLLRLYNEELINEIHNYIKAHPDRDAAAALIFLFANDTIEIEKAAAMLTERARNSVAANLYKAVKQANRRPQYREPRGLKQQQIKQIPSAPLPSAKVGCFSTMLK